MLSAFEFLDDVSQQVKSNPRQAQTIYEKARDSILSNHRDAVDCAAALFDAATSLHKQPPSDARWKRLDDIRANSDRITPSNDEMRKRRALASLVAIWSWDVVCHYGWTGSSRTTVELLRQCALSLPDFESQVVPLGRCILARRHEESLFNSRVPSVGEHHSSSKGSLAHSPLTTYDIQLLASIGKNGGETSFVAYGIDMQPQKSGSPEEMDFQQRWCGDDIEIEVRGQSLISLRPIQTQNFLLGVDRFGLLVPRKFAVAPSKRRRISARSKPQTGKHQSHPSPKCCQVARSSAKAAVRSHKGLDTVMEKTLERRGRNAGKGTTKASVPRRDGICATRDDTQAGNGIDRVSSGIEKSAGYSCAPSRSVEMDEASDSQPEAQLGSGRLRTANKLQSDGGGPAPSEIPNNGFVHTGNSVRHDGRSFFTRTSSSSFPADVWASAQKSHDQRMLDINKTDRMSLYALDLASGTLCQQQYAHGVSLDSTIRQRHLRLVKAYTDHVEKCPVNQTEHQVRKSWLRPDTLWAKIYMSPESDLGRGESATEHDADVIYLSGKEFYELSQQGKTFTRPVVIKEEFPDAGLVALDDFASLLADRYRRDMIQVRPLGCSVTESLKVPAFVQMLRTEDAPAPTHRHYGLNALDFHGITACSRPMFTRLRRYRLLETLSEADIHGGPGKRISQGRKPAPFDVSGSLSFNILGLEGAFSGPHMDALAGTWVRNLCGIKFWMIVRESEMTSADWDAFYKSGSNWNPNGKERLIVLEPDDVLFMPPGLRVIHAVHTPQSSLMEGGMLWDELNLLETLSVLRDIGHHQNATNEPIPFQLPRIIGQLKELVSADPERFAEQHADFAPQFEDAVRAIEGLGCRCSKLTCLASLCSCRQEKRRCTSFCLKHVELPPNSDRTCMVERSTI
jgi:hypothetical protein